MKIAASTLWLILRSASRAASSLAVLVIITVLCLASTQVSRIIISTPDSVIPSSKIELDAKSRDILRFVSQVDSLPEYLKMELRVKYLYRIFILAEKKYHKPSPWLSRGDAREFKKLGFKLANFVFDDRCRPEYTRQSYEDDMIRTLYYSLLPSYGWLKMDNKARTVANIGVAQGRFDARVLRAMSDDSLKSFLVGCFEEYQFGKLGLYFGYDDYYENVCLMHRFHGFPAITFSEDFTDNMDVGNRAYYDDKTNTVFLSINQHRSVAKFRKDLSHELPHSDQYQKVYMPQVMKQRDRNEKAYKDSILTGKLPHPLGKVNAERMTEENIKDDCMYDMATPIKGFYTIEYEAHTLIYPGIVNEFNNSVVFKDKLKRKRRLYDYLMR